MVDYTVFLPTVIFSPSERLNHYAKFVLGFDYASGFVNLNICAGLEDEDSLPFLLNLKKCNASFSKIPFIIVDSILIEKFFVFFQEGYFLMMLLLL